MIIHDFAEIAKALKEREEPDKKSPIVTDPNPPDHLEIPVCEFVWHHYPHGYLEAFDAYARAKKSFC